MTALGIIPARYHSSRLPGKPLLDILGKSMIQRVYEQAQKSNLERLIVGTDDQRIEQAVMDFGGEVMMTSNKHISGTDRCLEVMEKLEESYDVIVNIQGDEPFINPVQINQLIHAFENPKTQIATLAKVIDDKRLLSDSHTPKVSFNDHFWATSFDRLLSFEEERTFYKHIGLYAYRPAILKAICDLPPTKNELEQRLEQWRWLDHNYDIHVKITNLDAYAIDTTDDLKKVIQRFG